MSELAWRFFHWMCEPSKLYRWRFFFRITPRWLSKKFQMYMFRQYAERYPAELQRKIIEAIPQESRIRQARSEEELVAWSKDALYLMLHPEAYKSRLSQVLHRYGTKGRHS